MHIVFGCIFAPNMTDHKPNSPNGFREGENKGGYKAHELCFLFFYFIFQKLAGTGAGTYAFRGGLGGPRPILRFGPKNFILSFFHI